MADLTAAEVLSKARGVLVSRGWHQGSLADAETGAVCSYGAIRLAVLGNLGETLSISDDRWDSVEEAEDALQSAIRDGRGIARWNDDPSRSYEDVLLAFKHAEELAVQS